MAGVTMTNDPHWPSAASLVYDGLVADRRNVGLLGVFTYTTSLTARSWHSTPDAIREALERYSTWSYADGIDLAESMALVDYGDVFDPDGAEGSERVATAVSHFDDALAMALVLGGDNAATWHALRGLAGPALKEWGLIALDAHLDLRDGESNGSPVRQLLEAGLDGRHVVQIGLADFSNSPFYAARARDAGITVVSRDEMRGRAIEDVVQGALEIAGANRRHVYVDVDMDAADRSVVPGCPGAAPGGLSADEMRRFVRTVTSDARVRAMDITEIDVGRDSHDQRTVRLAALLVLEALAGVRRRK
jgi:formiminoglutamase